MAESTETDARRDYLAQIKEQVQGKVGEKWKEKSWSKLVEDVAWWLHVEKGSDDDDTVDAAAGLIKHGIRNEKELQGIANTKEGFGDRLMARGVLLAICDSLFDKYVLEGHVTTSDSKKRRVRFEVTEANKRIKFCQSIWESSPRETPKSVNGRKELEEKDQQEKVGGKEDIPDNTPMLKEFQFAEPLLGEAETGRSLYVRDCYDDLRALVLSAKEEGKVGGVVITGTPGIGKTMFGLYLIRYFAIEKGMTVLYKFRNEGYFVFTNQKVWQYEDRSYELPGDGPHYSGLVKTEEDASAVFVKYLKNLRSVVYIVDLYKENHDEPPMEAFTIILSSCNYEKYASAVTGGTRTMRILWMPTWTKQETRERFQIENLDERFERHGGVPRYLLYSEFDAKRDLNVVLDSSSRETFMAALDPNCKDARVSGRLVHYSHVGENYGSAKARFASKEIARRVATRFYLRERLSFRAIVDKMKFDSSFGSPRGILSELIWHHQFREGGKFGLKNLQSGTLEDVEVRECAGDVVTCEYDMRDLIALDEEAYVSPLGGTFPAVDAFYVTKHPFFLQQPSEDTYLIGLQMAGSINREQPLKGAQVQNWIKRVEALQSVTKVVIVFVVNHEDMRGWNVQPFKTRSSL